MTRIFALTLLLALGACSAFPPAQMHLPGTLATIQGEQIVGIDGSTSGRFQVAGHTGPYQRSEERLTVFDLFDRRSAHARFTMRGPAAGERIAADCRMRERSLRLDKASFITGPMAYRCTFTADGRELPMHFELQESVGNLAAALSRHERRGEIAFADDIVEISSVHRLQDSPFKTDAPIGYRFDHGGRPVAAVELNGRPRLRLAAGMAPHLERTVILAALAVALLWDPAESDLGE